MKDFFISYNKADSHWAMGIAGWVREAGHTVVMQATDFDPGSNFVLEMDRASKGARRTLAVLSPDYLTSNFTAPEWAEAFAKDPKGSERRLVPVRVRACNLTGLLAQIVYIDLVGLPLDAARAKFIEGIGSGGKGASYGEGLGNPPTNESLADDSDQTAGQQVFGDNNIQAGRDVVITGKVVNRTEVVREDGEIEDSQAAEIKEKIDSIVGIEIKSGKLTSQASYGKWHSRLKARYRCTSYKKLRVEDFAEAMGWLRQEAAKARPSLRRGNNAEWRKELYKGIYARWRQMRREKSEIYEFAEAELPLKKPITSLKDLGERNLKKLSDIIARLAKKQR